MRKYFVFALLYAALMASAQPSGKLSSLVQRYAMQYQTARTRAAQTGVQPEDTLIPAFVKLAPGTDESLLKKYGCRVLTSAGNIYIAVVPASQVLAMTADEAVVRQAILQGGIVSLSGLQKGVYAVQLGQLGSTLIRK